MTYPAAKRGAPDAAPRSALAHLERLEVFVAGFEFIAWIAIGGTIGLGANVFFAPAQREPAGVQIAVGALGAFIGGYVVDAFERGRPAGGHSFVSYLLAPFAAVALVVVWRLVARGAASLGRMP